MVRAGPGIRMGVLAYIPVFFGRTHTCTANAGLDTVSGIAPALEGSFPPAEMPAEWVTEAPGRRTCPRPCLIVLHTRQGPLHIEQDGIRLPRRFSRPILVPWSLVIGADCGRPDHLLSRSAEGQGARTAVAEAPAGDGAEDRSDTAAVLRIAVVQPLGLANALAPLSTTGRVSDHSRELNTADAPLPSLLPWQTAHGTRDGSSSNELSGAPRAFRSLRIRVLSYVLAPSQPVLVTNATRGVRYTLSQLLASCVEEIRGKALVTALQDQYTSSAKHERRLLVLCNPHSGHGTAVSIWKRRMEPLLWYSGLDYDFVCTTHAGHAIDIGKGYDAARYEGVCCISGDGMVQEFVSGLLSRPDWRTLVRRVPLACVACGTANVLAAGLRTAQPEYAMYVILKRKLRPMDAILVSNGAGLRTVSLCGIGWGIPADIAAGSEAYRWLGTARYAWLKLKYGLSVLLGRTSHSARLEYSADVAMDDVALASYFAELQPPQSLENAEALAGARNSASREPLAEHETATAARDSHSGAPGRLAERGASSLSNEVRRPCLPQLAGPLHSAQSKGGPPSSVQAEEGSNHPSRCIVSGNGVAVLQVDSASVEAYSRGGSLAAASAASAAVALAALHGPTDRGIGKVLGKDSLPQADLMELIQQASLQPAGVASSEQCIVRDVPSTTCCGTAPQDGGALSHSLHAGASGGANPVCAMSEYGDVTGTQQAGESTAEQPCFGLTPAPVPQELSTPGPYLAQQAAQARERRASHRRQALASILPRNFAVGQPVSSFLSEEGNTKDMGVGSASRAPVVTHAGGVTNVSEPTVKLVQRLQSSTEAAVYSADEWSGGSSILLTRNKLLGKAGMRSVSANTAPAPVQQTHDHVTSPHLVPSTLDLDATSGSGLGSLSRCTVGCAVCQSKGKLRYIGHTRHSIVLRKARQGGRDMQVRRVGEDIRVRHQGACMSLMPVQSDQRSLSPVTTCRQQAATTTAHDPMGGAGHGARCQQSAGSKYQQHVHPSIAFVPHSAGMQAGVAAPSDLEQPGIDELSAGKSGTRPIATAVSHSLAPTDGRSGTLSAGPSSRGLTASPLCPAGVGLEESIQTPEDALAPHTVVLGLSLEDDTGASSKSRAVQLHSLTVPDRLLTASATPAARGTNAPVPALNATGTESRLSRSQSGVSTGWTNALRTCMTALPLAFRSLTRGRHRGALLERRSEAATTRQTTPVDQLHSPLVSTCSRPASPSDSQLGFPHVWQNLTNVHLLEDGTSDEDAVPDEVSGGPCEHQPDHGGVPPYPCRHSRGTGTDATSHVDTFLVQPGESMALRPARQDGMGVMAGEARAEGDPTGGDPTGGDPTAGRAVRIGRSRRGFPKFAEQGQYAAVGCINVGPDGAYTHPSDGYLDLVIARHGTAASTVGLLGRYLAGFALCGLTDERSSPLYSYVKARSVVLTPLPRAGVRRNRPPHSDSGDGSGALDASGQAHGFEQEGPGSRVCNVDGEVFPGPGPFRMHLMPSMLTVYGEL